jgi:AhpD family alkylhydroperoxidase
MARIEPKATGPAVERARLELPLFMNQIGTLAHLPGIAERMLELYAALPRETTLPRGLVELAILTVSSLNACEYCLVHHGALGAQYGLTPEQALAFRDGSWRRLEQFGPRERLVIEYAEQVTRDANRVSDDLFGRLRAEFSEAQIVELTLRITLCSFYNKFNQALRIDIEDEAVTAFAAVAVRH